MNQKTRHYKSAYGLTFWATIIISCLCGMSPMLAGEYLISIVITVAMLLLMLYFFLSISYIIKDDKLIIKAPLQSDSFPISKIASIKPTDCILSAPAGSLRKRIAITFTDRKILKSTMPLIISPADRKGFIEHLLAINPDIHNEVPI